MAETGGEEEVAVDAEVMAGAGAGVGGGGGTRKVRRNASTKSRNGSE